MTIAIASPTEKINKFQAINEANSLQEQNLKGASREDQLNREFSETLDKIAAQLGKRTQQELTVCIEEQTIAEAESSKLPQRVSDEKELKGDQLGAAKDDDEDKEKSDSPEKIGVPESKYSQAEKGDTESAESIEEVEEVIVEVEPEIPESTPEAEVTIEPNTDQSSIEEAPAEPNITLLSLSQASSETTDQEKVDTEAIVDKPEQQVWVKQQVIAKESMVGKQEVSEPAVLPDQANSLQSVAEKSQGKVEGGDGQVAVEVPTGESVEQPVSQTKNNQPRVSEKNIVAIDQEEKSDRREKVTVHDQSQLLEQVAREMGITDGSSKAITDNQIKISDLAMGFNPNFAAQQIGQHVVGRGDTGSIGSNNISLEIKSLGERAQNFSSRNDGEAEGKSSVRSQMLKNMERIESALKEVIRARDGKTISVRLDPPSLGQIKVDVTLSDGQLHARLIADSPHVASALKEKAFELQNMLKRLGLQVERVSVAVVSDGDFQQMSGFFSNSGSFHRGEGSKQGRYDFQVPVKDSIDSGSSGQIVSAVKMVDHWIA